MLRQSYLCYPPHATYHATGEKEPTDSYASPITSPLPTPSTTAINLAVLREYISDESVDLIYLDPPFNSNASYNVLFREKSGEDSPAQIKAFTDTWQWTQETERTYELDIIQA